VNGLDLLLGILVAVTVLAGYRLGVRAGYQEALDELETAIGRHPAGTRRDN
jgi:hypothetical protein